MRNGLQISTNINEYLWIFRILCGYRKSYYKIITQFVGFGHSQHSVNMLFNLFFLKNICPKEKHLHVPLPRCQCTVKYYSENVVKDSCYFFCNQKYENKIFAPHYFVNILLRSVDPNELQIPVLGTRLFQRSQMILILN